MAVNHFDLIVLGSGPAGERGAAHAASLGKKVALVEKEPVLGGTVAKFGTLPSKTLREVALHLSGFRQRGIHGVDVSVREQLNTADLLHRERLVRQLEQARIRAVIDAGHVAVYHGSAMFVDARTVHVRSPGGAAQDELLSADKILIATGSSPSWPEQIRRGHPSIIDSEGIMGMSQLPKRLAVAGGGVIGCEYASIFACLGVEVALVEEGARLMQFLDAEVSAGLLASLRQQGVRVHLGQRIEEVTGEDSLGLRLGSGEIIQTDCLLVCTGRTGNTADLSLETVGISVDARGFIPVDASGATSVAGVFAAGDVRGFPLLASAAREQAVNAVRSAFADSVNEFEGNGTALPLYGIYTIPECALAGETEEALVARGVPVLSGLAHYSANVRGQIIGARTGFLKLLFHKETLHLLGVHILGEQASELIHVGLAALQAGAQARFFTELGYNYPTLSELYRSAAQDALAKLKAPKPSAIRLPGLRP